MTGTKPRHWTIIGLIAYVIGVMSAGAYFSLRQPEAKKTAAHLLPINELPAWKYESSGLRLDNLRIGDGSKTKGPPTVTVSVGNGSRGAIMLGVLVAFFDEEGALVAAACLKPTGRGILASGATVKLSAELPVPRSDIAVIRSFTARVSHGKVQPMKTAMSHTRNHS